MTYPLRGEPGTVVCGTLQTRDILPALFDEYHRLHGVERALRYFGGNTTPPAEWFETEEAQGCLEYYFEALNTLAPNGHYFGAHWGDGSDFGFWPEEES